MVVQNKEYLLPPQDSLIQYLIIQYCKVNKTKLLVLLHKNPSKRFYCRTTNYHKHSTLTTLISTLNPPHLSDHQLTYNCNHPDHDVGVCCNPQHTHEEGEKVPATEPLSATVRCGEVVECDEGQGDAPSEPLPHTYGYRPGGTVLILDGE